MIAKKSDFNKMSIEDLKNLSEQYYQYNIFNNSVVVNHTLLKGLEEYLNTR